MIELDIDLLSGLLMIDIDLWNRAKDKYSAMSIVVDTGASVTTVSKDILFRAGYDVMAGVSKRITTASGIEYVKEIIIDRIRLDTYEINDVLVYAHTFPQESFAAGVLGLNVLSLFDVNLLFSKQLIELTVI